MNQAIMIVLLVIILVAAGTGGYYIYSGDSDDSENSESNIDSRSPEIDYDVGIGIDEIPQSEFNEDISEATESNTIPNLEGEQEKALPFAEPGGRCGPEHNKRCPDTEMCNENGHCGEGELFDFPAYGAKYSGPSSEYHDTEPPYTKKCGPQNNMQKCRNADVCYKDGNCGPYTLAEDYKQFSKYAGPESCYRKGIDGCIEKPKTEPIPEKEYEVVEWNKDNIIEFDKGGNKPDVKKIVCESHRKGIFTHGQNKGYKGVEDKPNYCIALKGEANNPKSPKDEMNKAMEELKRIKGEVKDFESGFYRLKFDLAGVSSQKETIKFTQKFNSVPKIYFTTYALDTQFRRNIRYNCTVTAVTRESFTIDFGTWADSYIYRNSGVAWLAIESDGVQTGVEHTICWPPSKSCNMINNYKSKVSRTLQKTIKFSKPFNFIPKVVIGLTGIDANSHTSNLRLNVRQHSITKEGFILDINTWYDTNIYMANVAWLAVEPQDDVRTGEFSQICWPTSKPCGDMNQSSKSGSRSITKTVKFDKPFTDVPDVVAGLTILDMNHGRNYRVGIGSIKPSKTGFSAKFSTWADSVVYYVGANWIALD